MRTMRSYNENREVWVYDSRSYRAEMSEKSETFIARLRKGGLSARGVRYFQIAVPAEVVRVMKLKYGDYLRVRITKIELREGKE